MSKQHSLSFPSAPPPYSHKDFGRFDFKKKAFTLAEVLITLTIIGVIAAMTIPTLMSKYQNQAHLTALKKAYSQLSNAVKTLTLDVGCGNDYSCVVSMYNNNNSAESKREYLKKLSEQFNNPKLSLEYRYMGGWSLAYGSFQTADGIEWGLHAMGPDYMIFVDTNGTEKGPNLLGKDWHIFKIAEYTRNNVQSGTVLPVGSKLYDKYNKGSVPHYWKDAELTSTNRAYLTGKALELDKIDEADFK